MRKLLLMFMTIMLLWSSCKKEEISGELKKGFTITSTVNSIKYNIEVAFPKEYNTSGESYATLFVLDSENYFEYTAIGCQKYSKKYQKKNVIVVGIKGGDRNNDYTPTPTKGAGGKASEFLKFIKNDLIPYMNNHFRADTIRDKRIILGHSYGGLLGAYAFAEHNEIFGNYLILSPSIYYDDQVILKYEQTNRPDIKNTKQVVFISYGELEPTMGSMVAIFYNRLKEYYPNSIVGKHAVKGKSHGGSANQSIDYTIENYFKTSEN